VAYKNAEDQARWKLRNKDKQRAYYQKWKKKHVAAVRKVVKAVMDKYGCKKEDSHA